MLQYVDVSQIGTPSANQRTPSECSGRLHGRRILAETIKKFATLWIDDSVAALSDGSDPKKGYLRRNTSSTTKFLALFVISVEVSRNTVEIIAI